MAYTLKTIKSHLQKLNDNWNNDYWVFVANGTLCLMRKKDGERMMTHEGGGVDQRLISSEYPEIDADGGDW